MTKLSPARKKANAKWNKAHKDKQRIYQYRSSAKKFINEFATQDDLIKLKDLIDKKLGNM